MGLNVGSSSCRPLLEGIRGTGERQSRVRSPKSPSLCIPHPYPVFAFVQRSCTSFTWGRKGPAPEPASPAVWGRGGDGGLGALEVLLH